MARRPLNPTESREIADTLHRLVLMELMEAGDWSCKNMAFQGGTSLHLVYDSPRYSEDLDFLLANTFEDKLLPSMKKVQRKVQSWMAGKYPQCKVEIKDRRRADNAVKKFDVVWSDPSLLGTVLVRVEFYAIAPDLVSSYDAKLQAVDSEKMVRLHAQIPAAQREWIFHDKMHAIADRPYLKWRDLFDVWWLRTQSRGAHGRGIDAPYQDPNFWKRAKIVNAMYGGTPEGLVPGLNKFLALPGEQIVAAADKELAPFLPPKLWERMHKDQLPAQILEFVRQEVKMVRQTILEGEAAYKPAAAKPAWDSFDMS